MPLSLRVKLWIGWLFGWDKRGVRAVLLVFAVMAAFVVFAFVYDELTMPEPGPSIETLAICEGLSRDECVDRIIEDIRRQRPGADEIIDRNRR